MAALAPGDRLRLSEDQAWERLVAARHGSLATIHAKRGVDIVPVVFAVDERKQIFVPVDTIKAKTTARLQRIDNVRSDPRCALLVEHYESDWAKLWWVRVHGRGREASGPEIEAFAPRLATRYEAYRAAGTVVGGVVITPDRIAGWAAA